MSFSGEFDRNSHMTVFNIAMRRAQFTAEKKNVRYCQLFVESERL